jgi:transaldolase/glucose-6-phosphate isomerase
MSRLHEIAGKGQSVWLDNLRRSLISTGELQRLIDEDAITGVTSNPTIFAAAIAGSSDYDDQLRTLIDEQASVEEAYAALVTADIQAASDVLRPLWERTGGADGFVSVEVSPRLAHDADATIVEAREWAKRIDRDNVLIKVPATHAGLVAIEQLTAEGISVNVTLIFSLKRYWAVAEAYLAGLKRFVADGGDPRAVASFASFFVSRVDVEIDRRLDDLAARTEGAEARRIRDLKGKAGIANARAAYGLFTEMFSGEHWEALAGRGARGQKPLWASTGVKDPNYPDTMYVDQLVAPDTVNTMPEATIRAFQDHGVVDPAPFGERDIADALAVLGALGEIGIDYDDVTDRVLEREGLDKFVASYDELIACLRAKRRALISGTKSWEISGIDVEPSGELAAKVWTKDSSAWGPGDDDPADRLGWLTLPDVMEGQIESLQLFARNVAEDVDHVVLLGMGGSSLAPEMFARTFGSAPGYPSLIILDTTHPAEVHAVTDTIDPDRTLFLVSSKSGGTIETISLYRHFRSVADDPQRFVAITDPETSLEYLAAQEGFLTTFINPPDIGGRYSALSFFGLVPAALIGADLPRLVASASEMVNACERCVPPEDKPGLMLGTAVAKLAAAGRDKLTFVISDAVASFGDWVEQLIAESTGKQQKGIVPIVGEPLADPEIYGHDRVFVHVRVDGDGSNDAFVEAVSRLGHPVITMRLPDPYALGARSSGGSSPSRWPAPTSASTRSISPMLRRRSRPPVRCWSPEARSRGRMTLRASCSTDWGRAGSPRSSRSSRGVKRRNKLW